MSNDQKRAFLAILLSGVVLFGWQFFFADKSSRQAQEVQSTRNVENTINIPAPNEPVKNEVFTGTKQVLSNETYSYTVSNQLQFLDASSTSAKGTFLKTVDSQIPIQVFAIDGSGAEKEISVKTISSTPSKFTGEGNGFRVEQTLLESGKLNVKLTSQNATKLRFKISSKIIEKPVNNLIREFVLYGKGVDRFDLDDNEKGETSLKWFGVDYSYHVALFDFIESVPCTYSVNEKGVLVIETIQAVTTYDFNFLFTEKEYNKLQAFGNKIELSVDYSVFGILAVPILKFMQFIYRFIPNYGVAIIIVTFFLRLLLYPLQVKSFKSMKKMQVVQPEIKKIREKFKDDPKRVQQETMAIFKRAGANPLGGCFPLLLQMPFFFAIFQVLRNSIELVGAPFFGWITDLSIKDPYYVLPVLMCLAMVVQQKVTPSPSADPTQKKMMMIMPIVFGFIMKDFPSGLCLYIFISTLLGFAQQMLVYRMSD